MLYGLATSKPLSVWKTHLEQTGDNMYFEKIATITPANSQFSLQLDVDSIWTISTLTGQQKGSYPLYVVCVCCIFNDVRQRMQTWHFICIQHHRAQHFSHWHGLITLRAMITTKRLITSLTRLAPLKYPLMYLCCSCCLSPHLFDTHCIQFYVTLCRLYAIFF